MRTRATTWALVAAGALAACGAPPEATRPTTLGTAVVAHCPSLIGLGPWSHELFPGCPTWPIMAAMRVCDGACPRPCGSFSRTLGPTSMVVTEPPPTYAFQYDAQGRWTGWTGSWSWSCTYDGPHLAACAVDGMRDFARATRSATGQITSIKLGELDVTAVRYDPTGRVVAVGDDVIRYDDRGRMSGVGAMVYELDGRGRVQRERGTRRPGGPSVEYVYVYDDRDRVTNLTITQLPTPQPLPPPTTPAHERAELAPDEMTFDDDELVEPEPERWTIRYDGTNLVELVSKGRYLTTFDYACTAPPAP